MWVAGLSHGVAAIVLALAKFGSPKLGVPTIMENQMETGII